MGQLVLAFSLSLLKSTNNINETMAFLLDSNLEKNLKGYNLLVNCDLHILVQEMKKEKKYRRRLASLIIKKSRIWLKNAYT